MPPYYVAEKNYINYFAGIANYFYLNKNRPPNNNRNIYLCEKFKIYVSTLTQQNFPGIRKGIRTFPFGTQ